MKKNEKPLKVVCCWTDISGYMASCWKALSTEPDIDLHVIAYTPNPKSKHIHFDPTILAGVSHELLDDQLRNDSESVKERVTQLQPDVVVVPGWLHPPYRQLVDEPSLKNTAFIMGMDTPWRGAPRQYLARFALRKFLRRIDCVMVCGERAWQYAIRLGFSQDQIFRGNYGFDMEAHSAVAKRRMQKDWPRRFIYVGRYVRDKGLDTLISGYQQYRQSVEAPWTLTCCGAGPLSEQLAQCEGIEDRGFIQPQDLPEVLAEHGAFVLTSQFEPWGVVLAEAAASGLPVICTEDCGASVELVRSFYNGFTVPTADPQALCQSLIWLHENIKELPLMGQRGQSFAAAYSPAVWVQRWKAAFRKGMQSIQA